ncbi:mak16-a, partial [Symbiodinium pilosum]
VYEFVNKAIYSWPSDAKGAYVCFLSNPQNLDISHLIGRPEISPFAQALKSASHMLVVLNNRCSIYSRLWCVYEAFLAYKWDKPITAAKSVHPTAVAQNCCIICIYVACSSAGLLLPLELLGDLQIPSQIAFAMFFLLSLGLLGSRVRRLSAIHAAVVACAAIFAGLNFAVGISYGAFGFYAVQDFLLGLGLVAALEVDRQNSLQASKRTEELRHGFTSCRNAQCSAESDAGLIWSEIHSSGLEEEIEYTVGVLRSMNVSTRELRTTMESTGPLGDASHWNRTMVVSSFLAFWGFSYIRLLAYGHELPELDDSNYWSVVRKPRVDQSVTLSLEKPEPAREDAPDTGTDTGTNLAVAAVALLELVSSSKQAQQIFAQDSGQDEGESGAAGSTLHVPMDEAIFRASDQTQEGQGACLEDAKSGTIAAKTAKEEPPAPSDKDQEECQRGSPKAHDAEVSVDAGHRPTQPGSGSQDQ